MMTAQTTESGASMLGKIAASAPPVTVGTAQLAGFSFPLLINVLTAGWFVVLIAHKLWKWRIEARLARQGRLLLQEDDDE